MESGKTARITQIVMNMKKSLDDSLLKRATYEKLLNDLIFLSDMALQGASVEMQSPPDEVKDEIQTPDSNPNKE